MSGEGLSRDSSSHEAGASTQPSSQQAVISEVRWADWRWRARARRDGGREAGAGFGAAPGLGSVAEGRRPRLRATPLSLGAWDGGGGGAASMSHVRCDGVRRGVGGAGCSTLMCCLQ